MLPSEYIRRATRLDIRLDNLYERWYEEKVKHKVE